MNIWFVCVGEPVPLDGNINNLHRCGQLAYKFAKNGNKVLWITSNFDHFTKSKISEAETRKLSNNLFVRLLETKEYKKNISIKRFISHFFIANTLKKEINDLQNLNSPDIIYASYPTIELPYELVKFANEKNIPIIVDVRDLWPDIFLSAIPQSLHFLAKVFLFPWYRKKSFIFKNANSIIAISNGFLNFAYKASSRGKSKLDKVIYKSYNSNFKIDNICSDKFRVVYVGAISRNKTNLDIVIESFNSLDLNHELVICGDGDDLDYYKSLVKNNNIIFKGWVSKHDMIDIMNSCDVGIVPLKSRFDFKLALVNKAVEYLSYGKPIISSLEGDLKEFIKENQVGLSYSNSDELKECILQISKDKKYQNELSQNAISVFKENFDFERNFLEIENHFKNLISK